MSVSSAQSDTKPSQGVKRKSSKKQKDQQQVESVVSSENNTQSLQKQDHEVVSWPTKSQSKILSQLAATGKPKGLERVIQKVHKESKTSFDHSGGLKGFMNHFKVAGKEGSFVNRVEDGNLYDVAAKALEQDTEAETSIFNGEYQFLRYDERLEDFLDSLGMPGKEFGPVFRRSEVRIVMKEPSIKKKDGRWSMTHYDKGSWV